MVPSMLKGGFIVGAKYGRGLASCRTPKGWSAPAFFVVTGGSFGFQIGGQAVDLVMLIMNKDGMRHLLSSEFALGADASVAAGPVGRHAEGNTDWKMRAEVLTYSRARGLFAGVSLNGAVIKQDKDSTREFYGRMVPFRTSLTGEIDPPPAAEYVSDDAGEVGAGSGEVGKPSLTRPSVAGAPSAAAIGSVAARRLHPDSSLPEPRARLGMTIDFLSFANNS